MSNRTEEIKGLERAVKILELNNLGQPLKLIIMQLITILHYVIKLKKY